NWRGKTIRLASDASGSGPTVLLLPALSSISSRREMRPLQERLALRYSTLAVDWPGFGDASRPQVDWGPQAYADFLAFLLSSVMVEPHAIIAAGHAATYVLAHAANVSPPKPRLVLIAPTAPPREPPAVPVAPARARPPAPLAGGASAFLRPAVRVCGSPRPGPAGLPPERQPPRRALHGGGPCLCGSRLSCRRAAAR